MQQRCNAQIGRLDEATTLLVQVAWLYYIDQLTQQKIADRLRLPRVKVARLLQRARDEKLVEVSISNADAPGFAVARQLIDRFRLRDARVIPTTSGGNLREHLAGAAAQYLSLVLRQNDVVGVGMGATLNYIADYIGSRQFSDVRIVELVGALSRIDRTLNPYDSSWRLADALGAESEHLLVPAMVENPVIKEALLTDGSIRAVLERAAACDLALVGIGEMHSPIRAHVRDVPDETIDQLASAGAVGDILLRFFDRQGDPVPTSFDDQVIGLTLSQLKRIPLVVGVAGGQEKVQAISGALRGGLIDVLVCDQETALTILR